MLQTSLQIVKRISWGFKPMLRATEKDQLFTYNKTHFKQGCTGIQWILRFALAHSV